MENITVRTVIERFIIKHLAKINRLHNRERIVRKYLEPDPCILYPMKLKAILSRIYTSCVTRVIMKYDKERKKKLFCFLVKADKRIWIKEEVCGKINDSLKR